MNQNPPLTAEEAAKLTFPCLLEVWDFKNRSGQYTLITNITERGHFATPAGAIWKNAALPSPEIAKAMRKQFGSPSEFPKRMLTWENWDGESKAKDRIVLADLGEKAGHRYIAVIEGHEYKFENGEEFIWSCFSNAKPIPQPNPIAQEIAELRQELRQRLAELEARHNQQSK